MNLSDLAPGAAGLLRSMPATGAGFVRLREMGMLPGTRVKLVRRAPMGDPIEIEVRGYHLSIRREEAVHIAVEAVK